MDEEATQGGKAKLVVIGVLVVAILALVVVGLFFSAPKGPQAPMPGANAGGNAPANTGQSAEPVAQLTSIAVDTSVDVVRFGPTLPFGVNTAMGGDVETAGTTFVRGKVDMVTPEAGGNMIEKLADVDNETWVMLPIQPNNKRSLLGKSVATAQRVLIPLLNVDGVGQVQPLGFAYMDASRRVLQVEPDSGLRALSQTPELLGNRTDQKLWLLYRVPKGSFITGLYLGKRQVATWEPPLAVK